METWKLWEQYQDLSEKIKQLEMEKDGLEDIIMAAVKRTPHKQIRINDGKNSGNIIKLISTKTIKQDKVKTIVSPEQWNTLIKETLDIAKFKIFASDNSIDIDSVSEEKAPYIRMVHQGRMF
jgi:hypothetical protein